MIKLKVIGVIIILLVVIQGIPYGKEHINPKTIAEPQWNNQKTRATFFKLCGDCHSNETVWPIYSNIAPISWLVQHDVDEGRENLNVSMWGVQKINKADKAAHEYEEGEMPPWIYKFPRPQTKLSLEGKNEFIAGLNATFESN